MLILDSSDVKGILQDSLKILNETAENEDVMQKAWKKWAQVSRNSPFGEVTKTAATGRLATGCLESLLLEVLSWQTNIAVRVKSIYQAHSSGHEEKLHENTLSIRKP